MNTLSRLFNFAHNHKNMLRQAALFSVADALLELVPYGILYFVIIECMNPPLSLAKMAWFSFLALCSICARAFARWKAGNLAHKAGYGTLMDIRRKIAQHIGQLPMLFFSHNSSGSLLKTISEDVERIEAVLCHHIPDLCAAIAAPLLTLTLLFFLDWRLALAALLPLILAILCQLAMFRECSTRMQGFHDSLTAMNGAIVEYVQGIMDIKAFNQTVESYQRFSSSVRNFETVIKDWSKISGKYYALFGTMLGSGLLFVLPPGLMLLSKESLSMADFILFLLLVGGYAAPLDRLLRFSSKLREVEEGIRRIDAILAQAPLPDAPEGSLPQNYDITFENVSFSYEEGSPLFEKLNLHIPAGTLTAFVGPSGAGKTSAAMLISRYQDVQKGRICIGGVDIRHIPIAELLRNISFVFQDTFLFSDSVLENIRLARPDASDEDVIHAARQARAHDFITQLPQGYETQLGDGALALSGGERQRLAIARAVLRNAPIIILDEATAYADPENEALLQEGISQLLEGKTVIVIGHRLRALTEADSIAVFDQGTLRGFAPHDELLSSCSLYATMWNVQQNAADWSLTDMEESHA